MIIELLINSSNQKLVVLLLLLLLTVLLRTVTGFLIHFLLIFKVRASQKTSKNDAKMRSNKNIAKKLPNIDFGIHFGLPKLPDIALKSIWDAKKLGRERSLFRDAMGMARKSSQINGNRVL